MTLGPMTSEYQRALVLAEEIAKPFESCRLRAYWDPVGFPTNGWGNLLSRETKQRVMLRLGLTSAGADAWLQETWPEITQEKADRDFRINLDKAFTSVRRLVKIPLKAGQVAALIDFAFNLGAGNLQASTLLKLINRSEFLEAAEQFLRWNKAGGIILKGLTRRCRARRQMFLEWTTI